MSLEDYVECCECAIPVGDDGSLRAVLLLPCQHVLHSGCVDFIRRRRKLRQMLAGELSAERSRLSVCPACGAPSPRVVPLFASSGDAQRPNEPRSGLAARYKEVHDAQKANIAHLRALHEKRERVSRLARDCAVLHARRDAVREEQRRLAQLLPSSAVSAGQNGAARLAGDELRVEEMTATELTLYTTQSAEALAALERDVQEQRQLAERRRRQLAKLREKYSAMKEAQKAQQRCGEKRRERHNPQAERQQELTSSGEEGNLEDERHKEKPMRYATKRPRPVFDVDKEDLTAHVTMVNLVSDGSNSSSNCNRGVNGHNVNNNTNNNGIEEGEGERDKEEEEEEEEDVILVAQSVGGVVEPLPKSGTTEQSRNHGNGTTLEVEDVAFYVPQLTPVAEGRERRNAIRLLPRREDRLWQPSLEGLL